MNWEYASHSIGGAVFYDLAQVTYPDATHESFSHDAAGNLSSFTDRGGLVWHGTYNARGQLLTAGNPAGGVTTLGYDP